MSLYDYLFTPKDWDPHVYKIMMAGLAAQGLIDPTIAQAAIDPTHVTSASSAANVNLYSSLDTTATITPPNDLGTITASPDADSITLQNNTENVGSYTSHDSARMESGQADTIAQNDAYFNQLAPDAGIDNASANKITAMDSGIKSQATDLGHAVVEKLQEFGLTATDGAALAATAALGAAYFVNAHDVSDKMDNHRVMLDGTRKFEKNSQRETTPG